MDITIRRGKPPAPGARKPAAPTADGRRLGDWGRVEASHSEDNTADVVLASGLYLERVPVASREWVVSADDSGGERNSGERDLPPVNARVFVLMPSFRYEDSFVVPFSGFSTIDRTAPFMEDGRESVRERVTPGGWHVTDDLVTGSRRAVSPDGKTAFEIDFGGEAEPKERPELHLSVFDDVKVDVTAGEKATVRIFDTEIVIKPGEVLLKTGDTTVEVDGNAALKITGNAEVEAGGDVTVKANGDAGVKGTNVEVEAAASAAVKGATVTVEATALLELKTGDATAFCPNTVVACPWGFPHGGPGTGIVKLRGG